VIRHLLAAIRARRMQTYWVRADCGCAWSVNPPRVLVCEGHFWQRDAIIQRVSALLSGGAR
jgi:hypothetical protein